MQQFGSQKSVVFAIALLALVSFALPMELFAQSSSSSVRYGRSSRSGAVYLLPNRGVSPTGTRSIATGLVVSCAPSHLNASVGQAVTWFSSVTGGSGSYLYTWSGTEGFSGNASTVQKAYAFDGEKFATLTVTAGRDIITVSCGTVRIGPTVPSLPNQPGFGASCYGVPERIAAGETATWVSIVSGVTASTTYEWDGSDALSGNRPLVSKTYATNGTRFAFLTVTNGPLRVVAACTNSITVGPKIVATAPKSAPAKAATTTIPAAAVPAMQGLCIPSATSAPTGTEIVWQAAVTGGVGAYRFSWTGDDGLFSEGTTTVKKYGTEGVKKASVTVTSGGKQSTFICSPIEIQKRGNGLFAGGAFSWSFGPLCLILGLIIAIMIGLAIARRKRAKEEEEEEKDHVK